MTISYCEYGSVDELSAADRELLLRAMESTTGSYSPYSHFAVGAAVRMADGNIVTGSNQENVAYPSGLCAERVALFAASAQHGPDSEIIALAVVGRNAEGQWVEASPCGACRQVMAEIEGRQKQNMRVLMYLDGGKIRVVKSASSLLPLAFTAQLG